MHKDNKILTAAATSIWLGKKEYFFSPLSDKDITELDMWVQARFVENARNSLESVTDKATRDETLAVAMTQSLAITWLSGVGAGLMATPIGMARLTWQCVHARHPDVTLAEITKHMFSPENIARARVAFEQANPSSGKAKGPPPKAKKRRKGKSTNSSQKRTGGRSRKSRK